MASPGPRRKGPRLWLEPARREGKYSRAAQWVIRDHGRKKVATGYGEKDRVLAEAALARYCETREQDQQIGRLSRDYVYFITAAPAGYPIKIGVTSFQKLRLASLQTGNPHRLEILAMLGVADREIEKHFHARFSESRLEGEWFERTPQLMQAIADLIVTYGLRDTSATRQHEI